MAALSSYHCPRCGGVYAVKVRKGGRAYVRSRHYRGLEAPTTAIRVYWPLGYMRSTVRICDHPVHRERPESRWMRYPDIYALLASYDPDEAEGPARMVPGPPSPEEARVRRKAKARLHKERQASR